MTVANTRRIGDRCWAHDLCEHGTEVCTDCPDTPDTCPHTTPQEIAA